MVLNIFPPAMRVRPTYSSRTGRVRGVRSVPSRAQDCSIRLRRLSDVRDMSDGDCPTRSTVRRERPQVRRFRASGIPSRRSRLHLTDLRATTLEIHGDAERRARGRAAIRRVGIGTGVAGRRSRWAGRMSLEARGLHWRLRGRNVVDGVDLVVERGEIVGLLGPNGAGKTVTLSMMIGLLHPSSGRVLLDATDVTDLPVHKRARLGLSFLPQDRSIFTKMSASDNIAAILEARGLSRGEVRERTRVLLAEFGLLPLARSRASRLSGGEQRRLEVARSLAIDPCFLLFDEPFAGIDPLTIESLHAMLVKLRAKQVGVLITDHNVPETLSLCDRAYVLFDGRVLAEGSPEELIANAEVQERFLGEGFVAPTRALRLGDEGEPDDSHVGMRDFDDARIAGPSARPSVGTTTLSG